MSFSLGFSRCLVLKITDSLLQFSKSLMVGELNTAAISALVDYWFSTAKTVSRVSIE